MFTLEQINAAHSKVQTGADFPIYIREIMKLGVISFETHVPDGHTEFYGHSGHKVISGGIYPQLEVADKADKEQFGKDLKEHQSGRTNYMTFCKDCAKSGIERWIVDLQKMTCTYFDKNGKSILVEVIPTI